MKKLVLITNTKADKYYSHHFVDCNNGKFQIRHSNSLSIFSQDSTLRNGLYLIEIDKTATSKEDYIGYAAAEIIDIESKLGTSYIIRNYFSFNIKEKSAILRLCKDFKDKTIDDRLDFEKALLSTQDYMNTFDIDVFIDSIAIKINKYVNVKIGDCDKFHASMYPVITGFIIFSNAADKYLNDLKTPFIYARDYSDEQFCSGYEMKSHFEAHYEKEWQEYIDINIDEYKRQVKERYKRHKHYRAVHEQFLEKQRQELAPLFYQENKDVYQYIKDKFPFHINQYHRKIEYRF